MKRRFDYTVIVFLAFVVLFLVWAYGEARRDCERAGGVFYRGACLAERLEGR